MAIELYEHNITPFNQIQKAVANGENQIFVTATGTGKSYVAGKLIEDNADKRVMIVTPRRNISKQWTNLLANYIYRVDIFTYQKLCLIKSSDYKKTFSPYGLIIVDEVHHAGARSWGRPIEYCIKNAKKLGFSVIGLTADPVRYNDGGYDVSTEMFDDERTDGLALEDAITKNVLPSFNYISALFDMPDDIKRLKTSDIKQKTTKRTTALARLLGRLDINSDNLNRIVNIVKENIAVSDAKLSDRHVLVFVSSTDDFASAKRLAKRLGFKNIYETSYKISKKKNDAAMKAFEESDNGLLICVDMLNEGVHCKKVDTVIMLRRTTSPSIFFQQLGRALDSGSKKDIWVFDFVANAKALDINSSGYIEKISPVSNIIRTCCAQKITKDYSTECLQLIHEIRMLLADKIPWTEDEDTILRQHYSTEGTECFKLLEDRTFDACNRRVSLLGLKSPIRWTPEEEDILRKYYATEGASVANRLDRKTCRQAAMKARAMGLSVEPKLVWSKEDDALIKKYYAEEGTDIIKRLSATYNKRQVQTRAAQLGVQKDNHKWTPEEDALLNKYYPDKEQCMKALPDRAWLSILKRASKKGFGSDPARPWTKEEEDYLKKYSSTKSTKEIADALNRTVGSVRTRRQRLGFNGMSQNLWTDEEINRLREMYPTASWEELDKAFPNRNRMQIKGRASKHLL